MTLQQSIEYKKCTKHYLTALTQESVGKYEKLCPD